MPALQNSFLKWGGYGVSAVLLVLVIRQHSRINELEALKAAPAAAAARPLPQKPPAGVAVTPVSAAGLFDARTRTLLEELLTINASAVPGQVNERFQTKSWEVLFDNDAERRSRNFGLLLDALRPEDGTALHVLFNKMHQEGRDFPEDYARFASRWGQVDGAGAMQFYFAEGKSAPAPADVHNALKGWAQEHPQEALAWAVANREMVGAKPHAGFGPQEDPVIGVLRGWARTDLTAATAAMKTQFPDPAAREQAIDTLYVESLFGKGLDATLDWIKQLPDSPEDINAGGRSALQNVFRRIRDAGTAPEQAVADLMKVADQPWFGIEDMLGISHTFRRNAADFANALAAPAVQPVMRAKFQTWAGQNPEAMGTWLNTSQGTAIYDVGAAELARALRASDPEASATWAKTIQNPALQARAAEP
ncbi:MAG: hypothetical protein V4726_08340 [Verrucomicrobiota bacterium]